MKKIISTMLAVMMVVSLFAINVSAAPYKADEVLLSQDYEDAENTIFSGASAVLESEGSENHVAAFGAGSEKEWETTTPIFTIDPGAKLTFKAMVRDKNSLSLMVEAYGGTRQSGDHRGFVFVTNTMEPNVWYDCEITLRGTTWTYGLDNSATLTHPTTGKVIAATTVNTLSSNGKTVDETDDGVDNPVNITNYTNRIRFLTNANYGPDGTSKSVVTDEETEKAICDWIIDDVVLESIIDIPTNGVFWEQDFDDHANNTLNAYVYSGVALIYSGNERGVVRDADYATTTGAYSDMLTQVFAEELLPLGSDTTITTFDVCKKAPSAGFVVTLPRADSVARVGIVAKQLLPEVWYNFAIVRPGTGKGNITVYRKQSDSDTWVQLTASTAANVVDAPAAADGKDVETPLYISNTSSGNSDKDRLRFLISTVGYMNVYQGADEGFNVAAAPLAGSYYQIDNYKVALANDVELDVTNVDDAITANITVNDNNPTDAASKNVFIGYYAENGALVDVDFAPVANGEAELNLTAEGKASMNSAKLYLWDANNTPVMDVWDITDNL